MVNQRDRTRPGAAPIHSGEASVRASVFIGRFEPESFREHKVGGVAPEPA